MQEYLIACGVVVMLTSIVFSFIWFSREDPTRLSIAGMYFCIALFSAFRVYERIVEVTDARADGLPVHVPLIILTPVWTMLMTFNIIMGIQLTKKKRRASDV